MTTFVLGEHYLESALSLAHASYAAYEDGGNPRTYKGFHNFHFDNVIAFSSKDEATRGYLAEREDAIVLAFRGTDTDEGVLQDWAINLSALQILDNGAHIHQGFNDALTSVWDKINVPLQRMIEQKKRKVLITGHSLGGALATLATRRLLSMQLGQIETHTFGQPRVGDEVMQQQITSPFYRFAYASDPVAFVPVSDPSGLLGLILYILGILLQKKLANSKVQYDGGNATKRMNYTHVGMLKQIDASGIVHEDASNWITHVDAMYCTIMKIINEFHATNDLATFVHKRIKDHLLPNYVEKIAHAIKSIQGRHHK